MTRKDWNEKSQNDLRERSGNVTSSDKLVAFIYQLGRDYIPLGIIEELVLSNTGPDSDKFVFTNGHLANYAKDAASRLLE